MNNMRKSERKANIVLAKAKSYVASYTLSKPKQKLEQKLEQKPKQELEQKHKYYQVKNAEIVKISKGHFSVIAELVNGQTVEIPKRFKSAIKASMWICKYKK